MPQRRSPCVFSDFDGAPFTSESFLKLQRLLDMYQILIGLCAPRYRGTGDAALNTQAYWENDYEPSGRLAQQLSIRKPNC